ncbi:DUF2155 domain-containing protein [Thalassorhabdomicrobium marinisediminis]|uniref:DUF2155 domain-containing protein n=1 Tax=Thalassorhabdomicrobium marinisediminis TaxID=2170577 RepID=A0A2T7FY16_9RHOB|nr:DUF2155 domain-containing protein [Thalassorhabdomicrobium marinisediminis]PVA07062.1 DUF2155 domain-containing protein [Thalassorhabdomicrobium marinisediminis]
MRKVLTVLAMLMAQPLAAQDATTAPGGTLRVLDKITGRTHDLELRNGETGTVGLLAVTMMECRFPTGNRTGDAFALLSIVYNNEPDPVFRGWMIASAPALNALDHQRYDVWALRCSSE